MHEEIGGVDLDTSQRIQELDLYRLRDNGLDSMGEPHALEKIALKQRLKRHATRCSKGQKTRNAATGRLDGADLFRLVAANSIIFQSSRTYLESFLHLFQQIATSFHWL